MHLLIYIPEPLYNAIKKMPVELSTNIMLMIKNGIPLPKGHGRLIDENELLKTTESYKSELGRLKADPFVKCGIETVENLIKEMSAIIEADKGDAE